MCHFRLLSSWCAVRLFPKGSSGFVRLPAFLDLGGQRLLATQPEAQFRNGPEAVRLAAHAVALTKTNNPGALDTLGAAYAEAGRFPEAAATAQTAAELAAAAGQAPLAAEIQKRRQAYQARQPFRE